MLAYILRRLIGALYVLIGVAAIVFVIVHLTGDPAAVMMPPNRALPTWPISATCTGSIGRSSCSSAHLPSACCAATSRLAAPRRTRAGTGAGEIARVRRTRSGGAGSRRRRRRAGRHYGRGQAQHAARYPRADVALIGQSTPVYWLGIMLILIFAVQLEWLPTGGSAAPATFCCRL